VIAPSPIAQNLDVRITSVLDMTSLVPYHTRNSTYTKAKNPWVLSIRPLTGNGVVPIHVKILNDTKKTFKNNQSITRNLGTKFDNPSLTITFSYNFPWKDDLDIWHLFSLHSTYLSLVTCFYKVLRSDHTDKHTEKPHHTTAWR
jgi:hypothetical protein